MAVKTSYADAKQALSEAVVHRQQEAARLRAEGLSWRAIGRVLNVSHETARLDARAASGAPGEAGGQEKGAATKPPSDQDTTDATNAQGADR